MIERDRDLQYLSCPQVNNLVVDLTSNSITQRLSYSIIGSITDLQNKRLLVLPPLDLAERFAKKAQSICDLRYH